MKRPKSPYEKVMEATRQVSIYHADSLADIANDFMERAKKLQDMASTSRPRLKDLLLAEAHIWENAASILERTQLGKRKGK